MMMPANSDFANLVYDLIGQIPRGKVVSYSQIAVVCGRPGAARVVGQIAHFGPPDLPWHRLIKANGEMARGFVPGGPDNQAKVLAQEGISLVNNKVPMDKYQWI